MAGGNEIEKSNISNIIPRDLPLLLKSNKIQLKNARVRGESKSGWL